MMDDDLRWQSGRLLSVPSMSQAIPGGNGGTWCGRAAGSMAYNYFVLAKGGTEDDQIRRERGQFRYPDGTRAGTTLNGKSSLVDEPLRRIKGGWGSDRTRLISDADRRLLSGGHPSPEVVDRVFLPVITSISANNVCVSYTGMSHRTSEPIHIVVLSGFAYDLDGVLWLHIDDPATANSGHRRRMGEENIHVVQRGVWEDSGAKYWLRAGRLLEYNLNTASVATDLWGDYAGGAGPGIASWITTEPTPDGHYARDLGNGRGSGANSSASLPLDLGDGRALTDAVLEAVYDHVERGHHGGWYPVSENTLWHGGVHLVPGDDPPSRTVHACLPGTVVAARLGSGDAAEGPFGSRNFVLVRHKMAPSKDPGPPVEDDPLWPPSSMTPPPLPPIVAAPPPAPEPDVYFSLYMHLAPMSADGTGADRGEARDTFVTTTGVNYRNAPRKDPDRARDRDIVVGVAPRGTRFEPLPDAPQALLNTDSFQWGRLDLEGGPDEAYMTTSETLLRPAGDQPLRAADVPWLQTPEVFEVVTERNYRRVPRTAGNTPIGLAPPGTWFEIAPNPPEPEADRFRWGRVRLPTGPVEAFMSVVPSAMRQVQARELDTDLADRFCGGDVIAVERPVQAGDVLWEIGTHGLRGPADLPAEHAPPPLPEVLHWEVFSERNLLADLCRDRGLEAAASHSGDGRAGPPPVPRSAPMSSRSVLVTSVVGPETVEVGQPATFRVTLFNVPATPADRARVSWEVRVDGAAVQRFEAAGDHLVYTPLPAHAETTLTAHPFINSPADDVAAQTRVTAIPPWWSAEDPDSDFQADATRVLELFERLDTTVTGEDFLAERMTAVVEVRRTGTSWAPNVSLHPDTVGDPAGHLAYDELTRFYAGDPGGRATRLRHAVCRFVSEWGVPDVRAAVDALEVGSPEATAAAVERHQWWAEAVAAGVDLPAEPRLWHYHPLSFLAHVAGTSQEVEFDGLRVPMDNGDVVVISDEALAMIVEHEVSSEALYTARVLEPARPERPERQRPRGERRHDRDRVRPRSPEQLADRGGLERTRERDRPRVASECKPADGPSGGRGPTPDGVRDDPV